MPLVNKTFFFLLLFGFSVGAKAQSLEFKGKVVDPDSGLPLEGVTVSIPFIKKSTVTNQHGLFTFYLAIDKYNFFLVLSSIKGSPRSFILRILTALLLN